MLVVITSLPISVFWLADTDYRVCGKKWKDSIGVIPAINGIFAIVRVQCCVTGGKKNVFFFKHKAQI